MVPRTNCWRTKKNTSALPSFSRLSPSMMLSSFSEAPTWQARQRGRGTGNGCCPMQETARNICIGVHTTGQWQAEAQAQARGRLRPRLRPCSWRVHASASHLLQDIHHRHWVDGAQHGLQTGGSRQGRHALGGCSRCKRGRAWHAAGRTHTAIGFMLQAQYPLCTQQ